MLYHTYLLGGFLLIIQGSCGDIVLTQTPAFLTVTPGYNVFMYCKASNSLYFSSTGKNYLNWYQQKPGQPSKLLFYWADSRYPGNPERFSTTGSGPDFMLEISNVLAEDAAVYYCQQDRNEPRTVIQSRTKTFLFCFQCQLIESVM
uniref:Ig-like domain-containing protein n=1 Tax=Leptobrachium leishanense TaxID=445787 RepID=A0A8C5MB89_9ANUR